MNKELAQYRIEQLESEICAAIERLQELKGYTQEWTVILKTDTGFSKQEKMHWPLPQQITVLRKRPMVARMEDSRTHAMLATMDHYKFHRNELDYINRVAIYEEV